MTQSDLSHTHIAGVDEAGRGPLAGPVVAAAVILDPAQPIDGLADSKKLSHAKRCVLMQQIKQHATDWSIGIASHHEIDQINILQATLLAMQRAIDGLSTPPHQVLIDGNQIPSIHIPCKAIVKGDSLVPAISAASIIAKVTRDQMMQQADLDYPLYGFAQHKGYGTRTHMQAIAQHGICPLHRRSFAPIKNQLESVR